MNLCQRGSTPLGAIALLFQSDINLPSTGQKELFGVTRPECKRISCIVACLLYVLLARTDVSAELTLDGKSRVRFATRDQAREILGARDVFVSSMSPIDRQLRLQSDKPVEAQTYVSFVEQQAASFSDEEVTQITSVIDELRPKLENLSGLWPDPVTMIKSTGREEGNAPHCRGNAIVLPARTLLKVDGLTSIVAHELFHLLSRQPTAKRRELYAIIGFELCTPILLPDDLRTRKITNPDAPHVNCVLTLTRQERVLHVAPILFSKQAAYDSLENSNLFTELEFRLVPVQCTEGIWSVADPNPDRRLWSANEIPSFLQKIGRNTKYIIHPEEILADNFVHLILATPDLPDPWVVEELSATLGL